MSALSPQETKVMEELLTGVPSVVAIRLDISLQSISTIKTRVRRKEAKAKKLLKQLKKYKDILHPPQKYKGV